MDVKCGRQRSYAFSGVNNEEKEAKKISEKNFFLKRFSLLLQTKCYGPRQSEQFIAIIIMYNDERCCSDETP